MQSKVKDLVSAIRKIEEESDLLKTELKAAIKIRLKNALFKLGLEESHLKDKNAEMFPLIHIRHSPCGNEYWYYRGENGNPIPLITLSADESIYCDLYTEYYVTNDFSD